MRKRQLFGNYLAFLSLGLLAAGAFLMSRGIRPPAPADGMRGLDDLEHSLAEVAERPGYGNARALLIGIGDYNGSGGLSDLSGTNFDAAEVSAVLAARFGFGDVTLVVDRAPAVTLPSKVAVIVEPCVTGTVIRGQLDALRGRTGPRDGVLFFYAGHGLRDGLAPCGFDPRRPDTLLSYLDVAKTLRRCDAHHTLLILDSCFAGRVLERDSGCDEAVGDLTGRSLVPGADNLSRVFCRRSFQIISAGTGSEVVADQVRLVEEFARLARDAQGHSPFSATLLQVLQGLAGRPDGLLLASELGYQMNRRLVNDPRIGARQAPRFGTLGTGDGDFLFTPVVSVLNPEFVAPLYRTGTEYSQLREAACLAVRQSIAEAPAECRADLSASAVPHLRRLLGDVSTRPRLAAARVLADLATDYANLVPVFRDAVAPLAEALDAREPPDENTDAACLRAEAARGLGALARYATPATAQSLARYVEQLRVRWEESTRDSVLPDEVREKLDLVPTRVEDSAAPEAAVCAWEARRAVYQWLADEGIDRVRRYEDRLVSDLSIRASQLETRLGKLRELSREKAADDPRPVMEAGGLLCRDVRAVRIPVGGARFLKLGEEVRAIEDATCAVLLEAAEDYYRKWGVTRRLGASRRWNAVAVDPAGKYLLAGGDLLALWDLNTGLPVHLVEGHTGPIHAVAFSPDGTRFASASADGTLRVHAASDASIVAEFTGHRGAVLCCAFLPDGRLLSGSADRTLRLWDCGRGEEVRLFDPHPAAITACAAAADGQCIAAGCRDGSVQVWNSTSGLLLKKHPPSTSLRDREREVVWCAFGADGRLVAGFPSTLRVWEDNPVWKPVAFDGARIAVTGCAMDSEGQTLAVAGPVGKVRLYDLKDGAELGEVVCGGARGVVDDLQLTGGRRVLACAFAPGDRLVVATDDLGERPWKTKNIDPAVPCRQRLEVWDWRAQTLVRRFGGLADLRVVVMSPDGTRIVAAAPPEAPRVWDRATGRTVCTLAGHAGRVITCQFSADGREVVTGSDDGTVQLWDTIGGQLLRTFPSLGPEVTCCAISPHTGQVLAGYNDHRYGLAMIWNRGTGKGDHVLFGHRAVVRACAYSPDGREIVTGSEDGELRRWSATGRSLGSRKNHRGRINTLAWSSSGQYLLSGTHLLFGIEVKSGELHACSRLLNVHKDLPIPNETQKVADGEIFLTEALRSAAFYPIDDPDSHTIPMEMLAIKVPFVLSGSERQGNLEVPFAPTDLSGVLRLWDPTNRRLLRTFHGHSDPVLACAFSPDGLRVVSVCRDGATREFPLDEARKVPEPGNPYYGRTFEELAPGFDDDPVAAVRRAGWLLLRDGAPWGQHTVVADLPALEASPGDTRAEDLAATAEAQEERGLALLLGQDMPAAPLTGLHWLRAAADGGRATAAARFAWALERGLGKHVPYRKFMTLSGLAREDREAAPYREKVSALGGALTDETLSMRAAADDPLAVVLLAVREKNLEKLEAAAGRNEPDALLALAELRPNKARDLLIRAAAIGDPPALMRLGRLLEKEDRKAALDKYEEAAFLGSTDAMLEVARLLELGVRGDRRRDTDLATQLRKEVAAYRDPAQIKTTWDGEDPPVIEFAGQGWVTRMDEAEHKRFVKAVEAPALEVTAEANPGGRRELPTEFKKHAREEAGEVVLETDEKFHHSHPAWLLAHRTEDGGLAFRLIVLTKRHRYTVTWQTPTADLVAAREKFDGVVEGLRLGDLTDQFPKTGENEEKK